MALVVQARMFVLLAFACLTCLVLWPTSSSKARPRRPALEEELLPTGGDDSEPLQQQVANPMVQVDLHVMSMCPDAAFCEDYFTSVLEKVSDIAVLTTQYIAQENHDMGIACMHGEDECAGNRMQLCARELYPDLNDWFNFVVCQAGSFTSVPRNGEECARKVGLDYEKLIKCSAQDALGQDLLRASLALSKERGVVKSCSVVINNKLVCIRDRSSWYSCPNGYEVADFVRQICDAYEGRDAPLACKT